MKLTRVTTDDPVIGYSTIREWVPQAPVISEDLRVFFGAEKLDQFEINEIVFAQ
jgi:1,2-phenylacetyl-CoA epoxidase catalytic subunit